MKRLYVILFLTGLCFLGKTQNGTTFSTLNELLSYADLHSSTFKNANEQIILAKYETLAAKLNQWNLKNNVNFSLTDNTKLPVNYLPAEIFGGTKGTFKEITLGQQYVTSIGMSPQIDVYNPLAVAKIQVAKTNEALVAVTNKLNKKNLYESLAAVYFNILSLQQQIMITEKSLSVSDSLVQIVTNKEKEGLVRRQDTNDALANKISIQDKLEQLNVQLQQQYNSLKILIDAQISDNFKINSEQSALSTGLTTDSSWLKAHGSELMSQQSLLQKRYQEEDLRANKKIYTPTVSVFGNIGWQQNSNDFFFSGNGNWFSSNYIGVKINLPLPPDVGKIASAKYSELNVRMAEINHEHTLLQEKINNEQLVLDYQKAFTQHQNALKIEALKRDSYIKNFEIYKEGLLSTTDILTSLTDLLNSRLNTSTQYVNVEYAKSKITINNTVK